MDRIDSDTLQRYLDGDLLPAEAERVRAAVAASPELAAEVDRMSRLGDVVRASAPELEARMGDAQAADELFARIERAIAAPAPAKVVPLASRRRRFLAAGTAGLLAAAAAVFLLVLNRPASDDIARVGAEIHGPTAPPVLGPRGTEILDIDFGKSTGTHFSVEGTHGEQIAVVWISDSQVAFK
ncbi:MAG: hypothetical protein U0230_19830 [Polyangiales bacterium]